MPLIVKDIKWKQTEKKINIEVPLHGVHQSKVDLFTSPTYIKASFERHFFESFLSHEINPLESKCTITPNEIVFELVKVENLQWEQLEVEITKQEKLELKKNIIEQEHQKFQEKCKAKQERKSELKRVAVREQISLDTKQRALIDSIRNTERTNALGDVNDWQKKQNPCKIVELLSDEKDESELNNTSNKKKIIKKIWPCKLVPPLNKPEPPTPLPRTAATLQVDFTERQFPTPCRESKLEEENEWLKTQAEARKSAGFVSEDLRPEEKNPQYLKAKGDEFLKTSNYLGAISAYSFGIKLSEKFVDLYIGRSAAHFGCGNYYKTIEDCSKALELMKPEVPANLEERVLCFVRRGLALCKFNMYKEGIGELKAALKLQPKNVKIQDELEKAEFEYNIKKDKEDNK